MSIEELYSLCETQSNEIERLNQRLGLILKSESLFMQKRQKPDEPFSGLRNALYDAVNDKVVLTLNMMGQEKLKFILINKYKGQYNIRSQHITFQSYSQSTLRFLKLTSFVFSYELDERYKQVIKEHKAKDKFLLEQSN